MHQSLQAKVGAGAKSQSTSACANEKGDETT
jgi:hypothetical protein